MTTEPVAGQEAAPSVNKTNTAWSPTLIVWICILFTAIPASVVYALNFGRLGKPEKKKRALFFAVAGGLIYMWMMLRTSDSEARTLRTWLLMGSIVISWQFYLGQQSLFVQHIKRGGKKASLVAALAVVGIYVLILLAGGVVMIMQQEAKDNKEFDRAQGLMAKGKLKEAEAIFKTFKQNNPEEPNVYWNLAVIYSQTNRDTLAKQELQELLRREPDNKEAKNFLKGLEPSP